MVCAKCQRLHKTELATPSVKRKNDLYLGSPASYDKSKSSATSHSYSIGKVGWAALCGFIPFNSLAEMFYIE